MLITEHKLLAILQGRGLDPTPKIITSMGIQWQLRVGRLLTL